MDGFATPFFAVEYTVRHMLLDSSLWNHLSLGYYEAGHSLYTNLKSLEQAKAELGKFILASIPQARQAGVHDLEQVKDLCVPGLPVFLTRPESSSSGC